MEFSKQSERWEDEQLQTLELALGFPPGTITAADIEYLIQRSYAAYDDSEDDDLCFSMQQQCRIGGVDQTQESRRSSRKSSSTSRSASSSSQKRTSRTTTQSTEKSRGHHRRRK